VNPNKMLLAFIMKNEAVNLPRMLESVEPHIVGAAVTDTGSTDNSIEIVESFFKERGEPCWISRAPFEDFSQARNFNLRAARAVKGVEWDYLLLMDCDMEFKVETVWPKLTMKSFALVQTNGLLRYYNVRGLHRTETVEYVGKTHECLVPETPPVAIQNGLWFQDHETGTNRADKYVRDIKLLKEEILADPMNPRNIFYMVQSLAGAGMYEKAREMCDYRIRMGGHPEEIYWCLFHCAQFDQLLNRSDAIIEHEFVQAYSFRPNRAEPLHYLAKHHAKKNENRVALLYASVAASMTRPDEVLPVELAVYEWMALDTLMIVAAACGDTIWAKWAAKALRKRKVPKDDAERIKENIESILGRKK
jgi:glycosyltransferase involved in cell wall biosynthesis